MPKDKKSEGQNILRTKCLREKRVEGTKGLRDKINKVKNL